MKKIVLAGPPQSGKSCLRAGLKGAIRSIPGAPYPYVLTACPDGEGAWFQDASAKDAVAARAAKDAYKSAFTPEYVARVSAEVRTVALPLTLIDIGGRTSDENKQICAGATHAVLLAGPKGDLTWQDRLVEWKEFFAALGIPVIAEIHSDYTAQEDAVGDVQAGVLHASVHYLERGQELAGRPSVRALAEHILAI